MIALTISSLSAFWSRNLSLCEIGLAPKIYTSRQNSFSKHCTYIVSSTFSGVSLPWMYVIASPAFSMAASVSRLMLADSIELICCSSVPICATVCSR